MPIVYVNNFRGFKDTYIPLKGMNFLVGENSTGKTSILKLIKILSDPKFWFMEDFSSEEANLGHFNEIISKSSKNRKNFKIGILGEDSNKSNQLTAVLMKFIEKDGNPFISEVSMILGNINIHAKISGDSLKYRHRKLDFKDLDIQESNKLRYFKWWVNNNPLKGYTYTDASDSEKFKYPSNLITIYTLLVDKLIKENKNFDTEGLQPIPEFLSDITWMAPIRAEPKRTYDSYETSFTPEGKHSPYLLKKIYDRQDRLVNRLEKFGEESGLFEEIDIKVLGTRNTKTAPFEIHIRLGGTLYKLPNVGYGISQILPLLVEILATKEDKWFSLQQPEIHIHPKAQAAFGGFLFNAMVSDGKRFIIETHSDFIIDRFRYHLHQNYDTDRSKINFKSQVIFFEREGGGNKLQCIPILDSGKYSEKQSNNFRQFFINEDLNTIQI